MMSIKSAVKINKGRSRTTNGAVVGVMEPPGLVRVIEAATTDRRDIVRQRYTMFQPAKVADFLALNPQAVTMLVEAIPQVDAMTAAAKSAPIQLMVLSDQETESYLYARVIVEGGVAAALALIDKLDEMQWSEEATVAAPLIMFDAGIA